MFGFIKSDLQLNCTSFEVPLTFQDHGLGDVNSGIGLDRVSLAPSTNLPPIDVNEDIHIDVPGFKADVKLDATIDPPAINVPGLVPRI